MTPKQANTIRGLKTKENKAWSAMTSAASVSTAAEAVLILGEDSALVTAWRKTAEAIANFHTPFAGRH